MSLDRMEGMSREAGSVHEYRSRELPKLFIKSTKTEGETTICIPLDCKPLLPSLPSSPSIPRRSAYAIWSAADWRITAGRR
jgi:hypothetical protein